MKIYNISRLGNQIKSFDIIGINNSGSLILCGDSGEEISCPWSKFPERRMMFSEYNPCTGKLDVDIFRELKAIYFFFDIQSNKVFTDKGVGYFIEYENQNKINAVKCDLNNNTLERLCSVYPDENILTVDDLQLISLTENYFALKLFKNPICEAKCRIYIYDKDKQIKYDLPYSEDDDMRWADIKYINIGGRPHLLFIKYQRSNWKEEYYIHKWEWDEIFKKYKDEKMFLIPLQDLIGKGNVFLDKRYMITQVDENHTLSYLTFIDDCVVYIIEGLEKYDEGKPYEARLFYYNIEKKQVIMSFTYHGQIYVSNKGKIFEAERCGEEIVVKDWIENKVYELPYQNAGIVNIINDYLILRIERGLIIYDLKNRIEVGRYYTEDEKKYILPEVRKMALSLSYKYFEKEDMLILY
jgi:hypothetical protein